MNEISDTNIASISDEETVLILVKYEKSQDTMRNIIRQHLGEKVFSNIVAATIQAKSIGVIRYLNTINFVLNQVIKQNSIKGITILDMNRLRLALFEGIWQKIPFRDLISLIKTEEHLKVLAEALNFDLNTRVKSINYFGRTSLLYSHPSFLIETLSEKLGRNETIALLKKNNSPANIYLRINQLARKPDEILANLKEIGVTLEKDKDITFLFVIKEGLMEAVKSDFFRNGEIFIQDKASVFAVTTLDPKPGDIVLDACAAPGMKTQLMWELMKGKGHLIASDVSYNRLKSSQKRFQSIGVMNIDWINNDSSQTAILKANKILIDAPCSSTGILQSHPSYKWRLNKKWLFSIMTIQNKILEGIISRYSERSGTEIVYATCSVLPHEGENQIDSVLERYNIELLDGPKQGSIGYANYNCTQKVRRFFPHIHGTNGFFIAHFRIK
ncbi:MAG: RsmB/NOP family class I SAM-dependent RNA methyltransferase [Candidatus Heimdallarchaeota archaeon]|nr:RsmB/NOP family class I SAM-dependent RNA methyltransferase [Candidatus Heimdallarchaeota archaeon]MBY8993307.1 RsmB/NOP family class I SAM-dependent RNA methyltransferase [Candidatus Heimdallarchaeota archaeon]